MAHLSSRALKLFSALCDLPPAAWEPALDAACGDEPELRALVLRLLAEDAAAEAGGEVTVGLMDAVSSVVLAASPSQIGDYRIEGLLGEGGMGTVWAARHTRTGLPAALKTLRVSRAAQRDFFLAEIRASARLSHPGIVRVYDHGTVQAGEAVGLMQAGDPYLVMERIAGGTLAPHLHGLDWPSLEAVLLQLLDALAHAHAVGIVHRDIKPGNVLVDGTLPRVRLVDFGIARGPGDAPLMASSAGTPMFMAPEQIRGEHALQGPGG